MLRALAARKSLQVRGDGRGRAAAKPVIHAFGSASRAGKDQVAGQSGRSSM